MRINTKLINEPIGLGDVIKKTTTAVGIKPCSACQKRAELLNEKLKFYPKNYWTVPPNVPEGWKLDPISTDKVKLFRKNNEVIIWEIIDGQYKNSHQFCCADKMGELIKQEFNKRCHLP